jgi:nickel-dependent lactate racemase
MKYRLSFGRSTGYLSLREEPRLGHRVGPARSSASSLADDVRHQLAEPIEAPALYRACTADDRVAIVLDVSIPDVVDILTPIFETLCGQAGIEPSRISLVYCSSAPAHQVDALVDALPDEWADVQLIAHRADDSQQVAYLASTASGRRIYLSREILDADFYLVVSRAGFDPVTGRLGPTSLLFPGFSNEETRLQARRTALESRLSADHLLQRQDSTEVAGLAGLFYAVAVSVGADAHADQVWVGRYDAVEREANAYLDRHWRLELGRGRPDLVVAATTHGEFSSSWEEVSAALETAVRLAGPEGAAVALVSDVSADLGPALSLLRREDDPWRTAQQLKELDTPDAVCGAQLASAVAHGRIYFLSKLDNEVVESLGMVPISSLHELENLSAKASNILLIENANLFDAVVPRAPIYGRPETEPAVEDEEDEESFPPE